MTSHDTSTKRLRKKPPLLLETDTEIHKHSFSWKTVFIEWSDKFYVETILVHRLIIATCFLVGKRIISPLPYFFVFKNIVNNLNSNKLLVDKHYRFRWNSSTANAFNIIKHRTSDELIRAIVLDISKPFDNVWYVGILIFLFLFWMGIYPTYIRNIHFLIFLFPSLR